MEGCADRWMGGNGGVAAARCHRVAARLTCHHHYLSQALPSNPHQGRSRREATILDGLSERRVYGG